MVMEKLFKISAFFILFILICVSFASSVSNYTVQSFDSCGGFCVSNSSFNDTLTLSQGATILNASLTLTTDTNVDWFSSDTDTETTYDGSESYFVAASTLFLPDFLNKSAMIINHGGSNAYLYFYNGSLDSFVADTSYDLSNLASHCQSDCSTYTSSFSLDISTCQCLQHYQPNMTGVDDDVILTRTSSFVWNGTGFEENTSYRSGFFNSSVYSFGCIEHDLTGVSEPFGFDYDLPFCMGSFYNADDNFTHEAKDWNGSSWVTYTTVPDLARIFIFLPKTFAIFDLVSDPIGGRINALMYQKTGQNGGALPNPFLFSFEHYYYFDKPDSFPYEFGHWVLANNSYYTKYNNNDLYFLKNRIGYNVTGNGNWFKEKSTSYSSTNAESFVFDFSRELNFTVNDNQIFYSSRLSQPSKNPYDYSAASSTTTVDLTSGAFLNSSFVSSNVANLSFSFFGGYTTISDINITYSLPDGGVFEVFTSSNGSILDGDFTVGDEVYYALNVSNIGDYDFTNLSVDTYSTFGLPVYAGIVNSTCDGLNLSVGSSLICIVNFGIVSESPEFDEKLKFSAFGTPSDGVISSSPLEVDFTVSAPVTPPSGGGVGGSTTIIIGDKRDCNISFTPESIFIGLSDTAVRLSVRNDDTISYSPDFEFRVTDGSLIVSQFYLTNPVISVLPNSAGTLGVGYRDGDVVIGEGILIASSASCNDIEIPLRVDLEEGVGFVDLLFGEQTSFVDIVTEPFFSLDSKYRDSLSFINFGLFYGVIFLLLLVFSGAGLMKSYVEKKYFRIFILIVFFLVLAFIIDVFVFALGRI